MVTRIMTETAYKETIKKEISNLSFTSVHSEIDKPIYLKMMELYRYERIMAASKIEIDFEISQIKAKLEETIFQIRWLLTHKDENSYDLQSQLTEYEKELKELNKIKYNYNACKEYITRKETPYIVRIKAKLDGYEHDYNKQYLMMLGSIISKLHCYRFQNKCHEYSEKRFKPYDSITLNTNSLDAIDKTFWDNNLAPKGLTKEKVKEILNKPITDNNDLDQINKIILQIESEINKFDIFIDKFFNPITVKNLFTAINSTYNSEEFLNKASFSEAINYFDNLVNSINNIYYNSLMEQNYSSSDFSLIKQEIANLKKKHLHFLLTPHKKRTLYLSIDNRLKKILNAIHARYTYYVKQYLNLDFNHISAKYNIPQYEWKTYIAELKIEIIRLKKALKECDYNLAKIYFDREAELNKIKNEARALAGPEFSNFKIASLSYSNEAFKEGYTLLLYYKIIEKYTPLIHEGIILDADKKEAELRNISLDELRQERITDYYNSLLKKQKNT